MADTLSTLLQRERYRNEARNAKAAGRAIAKHCDARVKKMRRALALIDTFAWSVVSTSHPASGKELQRRINAVRKALRDDIAEFGP